MPKTACMHLPFFFVPLFTKADTLLLCIFAAEGSCAFRFCRAEWKFACRPFRIKEKFSQRLRGRRQIFFRRLFFMPPRTGIRFFCADCGVFLALFNLLPLCGFDGAQILKSLSFLYLPYEKALKLQSVSEPISLILFAAASGAVCAFAGFNLSLCVIFLYFFACAFRR